MMHSLDKIIQQENVIVDLPSKGLPMTHKKKMMKSRYQQARIKIGLAKMLDKSSSKQ